MSDKDIVKKILDIVGKEINYKFADDHCVEISLSSTDYVYSGLIRHHSNTDKQKILSLIGDLRYLKKLDLSRNKLGVLPNTFSDLRNLEFLNLGSNYLGESINQIAKFTKLKYLHIGNNDLRTFPEFLGEFKDLEYLALHKNYRMRTISRSILNLKKLRVLNLYLINLIELPTDLFDLTELNTLTLWNISHLPEEISLLSKLEYFTLCGSRRLEKLPDKFFSLKNIKMIRLYQNNLKFISSKIGNMSNLEQLSLYQNNLHELPHSFESLSSLSKLNLGWNKFKYVPACLYNLKSLTWLGIFGNDLDYNSINNFNSNIYVQKTWPYSTEIT